MSDAIVRIAGFANHRARAGRWNELRHVVIQVRTAEYRIVVAAGDQVRPQTILRKELSALRRIAGIRKTEWKSAGQRHDAAELPAIRDASGNAGEFGLREVVYHIANEVVAHV